MAFSYTEIVSDTAPIQITALLILDEDVPFYTMPLLLFKTDDGAEIECWDNDEYLIEFYNRLKTNQLDDADFLDTKITRQFIETHRLEIIELFELAQKAKMICLT